MGMFIMSLGEFGDIYESFARTPMDALPKVRKPFTPDGMAPGCPPVTSCGDGDCAIAVPSNCSHKLPQQRILSLPFYRLV